MTQAAPVACFQTTTAATSTTPNGAKESAPSTNVGIASGAVDHSTGRPNTAAANASIRKLIRSE